MPNRVQRPQFGRVLVLACMTAFLGLVPRPGRAAPAQAPECLIEIHDQNGAVPDNGTRCMRASPKLCTFNLQLCHNVQPCAAGALKKKVHATGHCNPAKLAVSPTDATCGTSAAIKVRTMKNGKKMGSCKIRVGAKSSDHQSDVDKVTLVCMPARTPCSPSGAFLDRADMP